jgi:hypothetical protein
MSPIHISSIRMSNERSLKNLHSPNIGRNISKKFDKTNVHYWAIWARINWMLFNAREYNEYNTSSLPWKSMYSSNAKMSTQHTHDNLLQRLINIHRQTRPFLQRTSDITMKENLFLSPFLLCYLLVLLSSIYVLMI